jgi:hypothetical protein
MDPSAIKSLYRNSFENADIQLFLHTYSIPIVPSFDSYEIKTEEKIKNKNLYDPFHNYPTEPFLNRDAIVLANIDAVFNFSKHTSGYIMPQETKDYTFATIDDEDNGFIQYMLYRNPNSYGYGISSKPINEVIDVTHFNFLQSNDPKNLIEFVKSVEVTGVDTVIGNYSNQINSQGYLIRLLTCLKIISIGGTFVCKIRFDETLSKLLYITSKCFEKITLFKPISTSAYDGVYYVIAQNANKNNLEQISYLANYERTEVSNDFMNWLHQYYFLINSYNQILIDHKEDYELYDTYKCKAMWNLP